MKIVVLVGSPHRNVTSNTLALEFVRGAKEVGKEVEIIDLAHTDIHPCMGVMLWYEWRLYSER